LFFRQDKNAGGSATMDHSTHGHSHNHGLTPEWSQLTFNDLWTPWLFVVLLLVFVVYCLFTGSMQHKIAKNAPIYPTWRKLLFGLGVLLIYVSLGSPLSILGHDYMFSAHMMQQSILFLVVPPLILLGLPTVWFEPLAKKRSTKLVFKVIQHPLFALLNFNVFFSFYHIPHIFDFMMANHTYHYLYHFWLQICAVQMWLQIVSPFPSLDRLRPLQKIGYIFANGVLLTPACALIIFADHVLYDSYANTPVVFEIFSKLDDQQLGGVVMKLMQEAVYGLALGIIFYRWFYNERSKDKVQISSTSQTNS
jgi:putative membrane protein